MSKEMPKVRECSVNACAYNTEKNCHALAITVGDDTCPACDTFTQYMNKGGILDTTGMVGACKVTDCVYNTALECSAPNIKVGWHQTHAECTTYKSE